MDITNEGQAQNAISALSKYFGEPVCRVSFICDSFRQWFSVLKTQGHRVDYPWVKDISNLELAIYKSNLLWRLIYEGQNLRKKECPTHKGAWSGCSSEPCPDGCTDGINITGWLPESGGPV